MSEELKKKCTSLEVTCTNWISVYRKKQKKSRWQNDLRQLPQLFTLDDLHKLDLSEVVTYAKSVLGKAFLMFPTMQAFATARNYLLMYLCLDNASRTGAIANMTLGEFNASSLKKESYRIIVLDYKTLETAGSACIVAQAELMREFEGNLALRNRLTGVRTLLTDPVFISWTGSKMLSSMVSAQSNSFCDKAVGHSIERPRISGALMKKSVVSKVYEDNRHLSKHLAGLMRHSEDTAKRVYTLHVV